MCLLLLLCGHDVGAQRLAQTDSNGADSMHSPRREHRATSASRNCGDGGDGASRDEDGADNAHGLGVLACDELERRACVEQPGGCLCGCYDCERRKILSQSKEARKD